MAGSGMVGRKNIIFGFFLLVFTVALGPYMIVLYGDWGAAYADKQAALSALEQMQAGDYQEDPQTLEDLSAKQLAQANAEAVISLNKLANAEFIIDEIKGGPHAHGNLEAMLNIVVGLVLCFIAAPVLWKQIVSWIFIVGTLLHSGMLYLGRVFELAWANTLLNTGVGPALILLGLLLMAILVVKGLRGEPVRD